MNSNKRSLALRLSLIISAIVLVGFVVVTLVVSSMVRDNMYANAVERANSSMDAVVDQIDVVMERSQEEIQSFLPVVEWYAAHAHTKDSLVRLSRLFVAENSWAKTAKIAFLPQSVNGAEKYLAYISYRNSDDNIVDAKFTQKEDYATWDWFLSAIQSETPSWSEPFFNHTCNTIVNTFFCPIEDPRSGEVVAIWAVDVEFIGLREMLSGILPYPTAFGYILSKEGRFMAHPQKECRLKKVDELDPKYRTPAEEKLFATAIGGQEGDNEVEIAGNKALAVFRPLEQLGGSLIVVCPFSDIFASADFVRRSIWNELLIALVVIAVLILLIIYFMMKPLRGFSKGVRAIADGNYDVQIPDVRGKDELSDVHDAIIYLQRSLKDNIDQLTLTTASKARIESEIGVAQSIQQSLLTNSFSFKEYPCLDLYAKIKAAREVGGDLYDFFIRDGKLFFAIGDVSGKGVPASLFMAIACKIFRVVAASEDSPEVIAFKMNQALTASNDQNMFVTMFIGVLNLSDGNLTYTNAGHNPPLIIGTEYSRYLEVQPNVPLGAFADYDFTKESITLGEQDALLLYTDGVTEAQNQKGELFGDDALLGFAFGASFYLSKEVVTSLYKELSAFADGAPQSDDISVFCIRGGHGANGILGTLTLANTLDESRTIKPFIDRIAARFGIDEMESGMINLALEEVVVNVIYYAYPSGSKGEIYLRSYMENGALCFEVVDRGVPFDPTAAPRIDTNAPASERTLGGLGIHLAREIFPVVEYLRQGEENHLTLKKKCQVV